VESVYPLLPARRLVRPDIDPLFSAFFADFILDRARQIANGADDINLVLKAGVAHLWFVTIHPFEDGNGRIARAIADMSLARSAESPQRFYNMSAQIRLEQPIAMTWQSLSPDAVARLR
jgi:Fic family protein